MIDHRLHVLRMVASHGTVTAAARALNYTPSAVSHQLRSLARELGVTLLVQEGRGVRLTPAARTLLTYADELYARWEEIQAELAATGGRGLGTLRLCGFSTAAAALLPQVATHLRTAHPETVVQIIEADPEECFDLLLADQADVAVVVATSSLPPSVDPRFDQEPLLDDPLDVLLPTNHPLAAEKSVRLSQTAAEPWILDRPGRPYHQLVMSACTDAGFTPAIAHRATEWETAAALVAAGLGIAMIPRLSRLPAGYAVARVHLHGDPSPSRHILTSVRRGSAEHPEIATTLAALRAVAGRSQQTLRVPAAGQP
ncbi:LysR family transcriptional regulator [Flexivirga endophytica]|uniref:LysR family transcriptional regulator n=1 Tax=Flexivirga endophytica TaxID=1849103 RepID=A0A916T4J4_9MICO|nr:LysR family transcriptional regulator [Flexivirga endophytica]GGB31513.1 LysR family transcriptional regulator [Flexivirga endophytica]GHB52441.1 LysR family transcriptional regulator [Flexivirga endophytica]